MKAKGFRNVLVHEYVEIDYDLLHEHLQKDAGDLLAFAQALASVLQQ